MGKKTGALHQSRTYHCDLCDQKKCKGDTDCFQIAPLALSSYVNDQLHLAKASSKIEGTYYLKRNRLEEIILFSQEMGYKKLGIAFCIGLAEEAKILSIYLRNYFQVVSICCKVGGIQKERLDLEKIDPEMPETMCNPIGQAMLLNRAQTDLNLICGLCIGHDIQFTNHSKAPVTTFIVKDRVLAHNPAASLYCSYVRKRLDSTIK